MLSDSHVCADVSEMLAAFDETELLSATARRHTNECLRCQAELAGFRRLRRSMRELLESPPSVDPSIHHEILFGLDHEDERASHRLVRTTAATIGGLAAAAGVIVVASRQIRSSRLAS